MMRKGQAAMEFLMTYGWAILVVLVAIGALAYFGVLSPSRFLPESCTIAPGIGCKFQATATGISLILTNGLGADTTAAKVTVTGCGSQDDISVTGRSAGVWNNGDDGTATVSCTLSGRFKYPVVITYNDGDFVRTKTGEVVGSV